MPDQNTIVTLPGGEFGYQTLAADSGEPVMRRWVWPLVNVRIETGMRGANPTEAIGKIANCREGAVTCYLGDGTWFRAEMPNLGSTHAVIMDSSPVPRPKVRAGIDVRWRGLWQKYSKTQRAWVVA